MDKYSLHMLDTDVQVSLRTFCLVKLGKFLLTGAYLLCSLMGLVNIGNTYLNGHGVLGLFAFFALITSWTFNGTTYRILPDNKITSRICQAIMFVGFVYFLVG